MRILQLINTLEEGGAEQLASTLALRLQAQGHSVHLVCMRDLGVMPVSKKRFDEAGVHLRALNKRDGFDIRALRQLAAHVKDHQMDLIHTHNPLVNHYGAAAASLAGGAVVVNTLHGISTLAMPPWAGWLYKASFGGTARVVSVCRAVEKALADRFHIAPRRSAVIYNGIELERLSSVPRLRRGNSLTFGTMARLVPVKDHESLLRAFAEVRSAYHGSRLRILGSGQTEESLRRLAVDLGLDQSVEFLGWSNCVAEFLRSIEIFVLSSRSEGLPLTVLESMAAGRPIVSTAVGGVPEVLGNAQCGWLCPPERPEALAAAMIQAVKCDNLDEVGERGRKACLELYSLERMVREYDRLFHSLL